MIVVRIQKDEYGNVLTREEYDVPLIRESRKGYAKPGRDGRPVYVSAAYWFPAGSDIREGDMLRIAGSDVALLTVYPAVDIFGYPSHVKVEV